MLEAIAELAGEIDATSLLELVLARFALEWRGKKVALTEEALL